jgi:hypothetical protein
MRVCGAPFSAAVSVTGSLSPITRYAC